MRVLIALTYYRPYISGLTIYAERVARSLAQRGHAVTVLASRHQSGLPQQEIIDGVKVNRLNVAARISKGVIMPALPFIGWKLLRQADIVNLHLPQFESTILAILARLLGKRLVVTYQCDIQLPSGLVNRLANTVVTLANHVTARLAHVIVVLNQDYADHSTFLRRYLHKVRPVLPPVVLADLSQAGLQSFRLRARLKPGERLIGMAARLASEKGVEYLAKALPIIMNKYPHARVLYVGPYENVLGEAAYARRVLPLIETLGDRWTFLGTLPDAEMPAFYEACDVTVLPSLNSTEAFGMVQVESMTCGTPVIASDLPGLRQPVKLSGMGEIVPPADEVALAGAILQVLDNPQAYKPGQRAASLFTATSPEHTAIEYEKIFDSLLKYPPDRDLAQSS